MKKSLRIVFMGTPEFAVESLRVICNSRHQIVAAVTAPDKPAGRGSKIRTSAVKDFCEEQGITVWQPTNLKDEPFLDRLRFAAPDLIVVVAFRMLPAVVWKIPPMGTINLHASLLPAYRGAAPINWAIINGEKETGVTTFFINEKIDTGDILDQQRVKIEDTTDAGQLHDQLKDIGAQLLLTTMDRLSEGNLRSQSQQETDPTQLLPEAPKINKQNSHIDWNRPASDVLNLIRGMSPYPGAYSINTYDNSIVKFFKAAIGTNKLSPGVVSTDDRKHLEIGTGTVALRIEELQVQGKKRMTAAAFLNGFNPEKFKTLE